ncbi:MAG: serine/threonine protein kinase [Thermoguttaceae bacterium]|nr:serine/threonine protein kinase [Thermoguttaceae bacterium]
MNPRTVNDEVTMNDDFELRDLAAGVTLCGKYRLELEAGKGGMGVVWKAWDAIGERWVALKFLPPGIRHSENAMAQVKSAFHTVQALNHPNICPVYGLEKDPTFGYFVVKKWLEGQPLNELQLPREEILPVLEKVAEALDYAHSEKVIHRDVKPSNIFIGTDGKVTLIDFGIAANLHSENQATQGQFASSGTEKYMAPEQRSGQLQTAQTDEYALALVAMELFAGSLSPLAFRKVAPEIQDVLETALADKPVERFVTCREFIRMLSRAADKALKSNPAPEVKSNSLEAIVALERLEAEEEQRAEEEKLAARIKRLEEKIQTLYRNKQYEEAILDLEVLLKFQPDDQNALFLVRMCEKRLEEKKRAEQEQINKRNREKAKRIEIEQEEQARREAEERERQKFEAAVRDENGKETESKVKRIARIFLRIFGILDVVLGGLVTVQGLGKDDGFGVVLGIVVFFIGLGVLRLIKEKKPIEIEPAGNSEAFIKKGLRVAESIWGILVVICAVIAGLFGCVFVVLGIYCVFESKGASLIASLIGVFFLELCYMVLRRRFGRR